MAGDFVGSSAERAAWLRSKPPACNSAGRTTRKSVLRLRHECGAQGLVEHVRIVLPEEDDRALDVRMGQIARPLRVAGRDSVDDIGVNPHDLATGLERIVRA